MRRNVAVTSRVRGKPTNGDGMSVFLSPDGYVRQRGKAGAGKFHTRSGQMEPRARLSRRLAAYHREVKSRNREAPGFVLPLPLRD